MTQHSREDKESEAFASLLSMVSDVYSGKAEYSEKDYALQFAVLDGTIDSIPDDTIDPDYAGDYTPEEPVEEESAFSSPSGDDDESDFYGGDDDDVSALDIPRLDLGGGLGFANPDSDDPFDRADFSDDDDVVDDSDEEPGISDDDVADDTVEPPVPGDGGDSGSIEDELDDTVELPETTLSGTPTAPLAPAAGQVADDSSDSILSILENNSNRDAGETFPAVVDDEPEEEEPKKTKKAKKTSTGTSDTMDSVRDAMTKFKIPLIILAVVTAIVVVSFVALSLMGRDSGSEDPNGAPPPISFPTETQAPQADAPIMPATHAATCQAGSTSIEGALDDLPNTTWICQRSLGIDGNVATFTFDKPVVINKLIIVPGNAQPANSNEDRWSQYRVVTKIRVTVNNVANVYTIDPKPTPVEIPLISPTTTSDMEIVITQTIPGSTGLEAEDAFAVSDLKFIGRYAN